MNKYDRPKIGDRFGKWTVIGFAVDSSARSERRLRVQCDCGKIGERGEYPLLKGRSVACGSCTHNWPKGRLALELQPGDVYGRLTITEFAGYRSNDRMWRARCECGNDGVYRQCFLRSGRNTQCKECAAEERRMLAKIAEENARANIEESREKRRMASKNAFDEALGDKVLTTEEYFKAYGMVYRPEDVNGYKVVRCDVFTREGFLREHGGAEGLGEWMERSGKTEFGTDDWILFLRESDEARRRGVRHESGR